MCNNDINFIENTILYQVHVTIYIFVFMKVIFLSYVIRAYIINSSVVNL